MSKRVDIYHIIIISVTAASAGGDYEMAPFAFSFVHCRCILGVFNP
jgi:hypothetical protein